MPHVMSEADGVCAGGRSQSDQYSSVPRHSQEMETTLRSCRKSGEDSVCEFEARISDGPGKTRRLEAKKQVYVIENSRNSTSIGQMYEVNRPS